MAKITYNRFPGGVCKCFTMSYDDGRIQDKRLVDIFNQNGIKGTFHLNSGRMKAGSHVTLDEVAEVYSGHEVSCHMLTHPFPVDVPGQNLLYEIGEDRKLLEKACGYIVRGMSYPYGNYDQRSIDYLKAGGMEYSRTTLATQKYTLPEDFMRWHPTCHHKMDILPKAEQFLKDSRWPRPELFYLWGHSYEFDNDNNWDLIEEFCKKIGFSEKVWYATNIEIVDYVNALRALKIGQELDMVYNPSAIDVWISVDGDAVKIPAGQTVKL